MTDTIVCGVRVLNVSYVMFEILGLNPYVAAMPELFSMLATAIVVVHAIWIVWVVCGPWFARRKPGLRWLHLSCVAATLAVQAEYGWCPFTTLEQLLQQLAGRSGYTGGFIEHYASVFVYGDLVTFTPAAMVVGLATIAAASLWAYLYPVLGRVGE